MNLSSCLFATALLRQEACLKALAEPMQAQNESQQDDMRGAGDEDEAIEAFSGQRTARFHDPVFNTAGSRCLHIIVVKSRDQIENAAEEEARYNPQSKKWLPTIPPVGNRNPGG